MRANISFHQEEGDTEIEYTANVDGFMFDVVSDLFKKTNCYRLVITVEKIQPETSQPALKQPIQQPTTPKNVEKEESIPTEAAEETASQTPQIQDIPPEGMKTCKTCREQKPKDEFYIGNGSCKECCRKKQKEYDLRRKAAEKTPEPSEKQKPEPPRDTEIFLRWLDGKDEFNAKDFLDDNPMISKEDVDRILTYLLNTEKIYQWKHGVFRVNP